MLAVAMAPERSDCSVKKVETLKGFHCEYTPASWFSAEAASVMMFSSVRTYSNSRSSSDPSIEQEARPAAEIMIRMRCLSVFMTASFFGLEGEVYAEREGPCQRIGVVVGAHVVDG